MAIYIRLRVLKDRVQRKVFKSEREEITGDKKTA